jgi:hypothetical protein
VLAKQVLYLDPHLQFILCWLFWRWGLLNYLPELTFNLDPPISASQVARIKGMSCLFKFVFWIGLHSGFDLSGLEL